MPFDGKAVGTPVDCQAISLPPPADPPRLATSGDRRQPIPFYATAAPPATNLVSLRRSAQAIRMSLLANATTTVLP